MCSRGAMLGPLLDVFRLRQYFDVIVRTRDVALGLRDDAGFLDGQYTVWGEVESGMEHVDALPVGEPPREPGKIVKATVS